MINKLQSLKDKTNLKFYKKISNFYDKMNSRMVEDPFAKHNMLKVSVKIVMKFFVINEPFTD